MPREYTIPQSADQLSTSDAVVYDYIQQGVLQGVRRGLEWRVSEDSLNNS